MQIQILWMTTIIFAVTMTNFGIAGATHQRLIPWAVLMLAWAFNWIFQCIFLLRGQVIDVEAESIDTEPKGN